MTIRLCSRCQVIPKCIGSCISKDLSLTLVWNNPHMFYLPVKSQINNLLFERNSILTTIFFNNMDYRKLICMVAKFGKTFFYYYYFVIAVNESKCKTTNTITQILYLTCSTVFVLLFPQKSKAKSQCKLT